MSWFQVRIQFTPKRSVWVFWVFGLRQITFKKSTDLYKEILSKNVYTDNVNIKSTKRLQKSLQYKAKSFESINMFLYLQHKIIFCLEACIIKNTWIAALLNDCNKNGAAIVEIKYLYFKLRFLNQNQKATFHAEILH